MGQSLSPFYPVGPHYLRHPQPPQVPATPPSKAPAPQPFPNVGHLRMCHRKMENSGREKQHVLLQPLQETRGWGNTSICSEQAQNICNATDS